MEFLSMLYVVGFFVRFQWEFVFGDLKDWNDFEQIVWGKIDNRVFIKIKYIIIDVISGNFFNFIFYVLVKFRVFWVGNCF